MKDGWPRALAIAAAIAVWLLALTPLTTLWDRDEPRFAQAAVEMLASGDYLVPSFNGELRAQKPPLIYWLMTLSVRVAGPTELAVRFWSPIGMAVAALATFSIGRRLWSSRVGHSAMLVFALTPLTIVEGVAATTDAVLLAAVTCAIACGVGLLTDRPRPLDALGLGLALGVGLLTKGPVGLVLPLAILVGLAWSLRQALGANRLVAGSLMGATVVGVAIFAMWLVPANAITSGAITERGLIRENVARAFGAMEGHGTPILLAPFYYPAVVLAGLFPWSLRLTQIVPRLVRGEIAPTTRARVFLLRFWILVPLVVFTLAATKLPHYILPVWPALALAVATVVDGDVAKAGWGRWARRAVLAGAGVVLIALVAARPIEQLKPVPAIAAAIRASDVEGPLYVFGFEEPSLVFYSQRRVIPLGSADAVVAWSRVPGPSALVATREAVARVERELGSLGLREIAAASGWNYVNGRAIELVAFVRARGR